MATGKSEADGGVEPNYLGENLVLAAGDGFRMAKDVSGIPRLQWAGSVMTVSAKAEEKGSIQAKISAVTDDGPRRIDCSRSTGQKLVGNIHLCHCESRYKRDMAISAVRGTDCFGLRHSQ